MKLDDIYILDDQGSSPNNDFIGECRIQTQFATGNGDLNQFSAVNAASNYQAVDDPVSDDDATFTRSGVVGAVDDYQMGTVALTGSIFGVQVNVTQKKDDVGQRMIVPVIRSVNQTYPGTSVSCTSDYAVTSQIYPVEPHSTQAWTNALVNSIYAGIKIVG
jgi:hypothetical protein